MAKLIIGTCSWKYESWKGLIYSESVANYLAEYAEHYKSVEVDQWFWSLYAGGKIAMPVPAVVQEYARSVPDDFVFTIKMPNSITLTHYYQKEKNSPLLENPHFLSLDLMRTFLSALAPLQSKIGPLMFQFEYLNKQKMASQKEFLKRFGSFIETCDRKHPFAVELRNPNYLNEDYFSFLETHQLMPVFLQGYYMPSIVELYRKWGSRLRMPVVIRLHGPDRPGMEKRSNMQWDRLLEPRDEELDEIARMIQDLLYRELDVFLNVNNHYEGSAPLTIRRVLQRLK
jgi:uncharacterized protein YecE (DUF72 family)